jgi:hypothetical protein
MPTHPITFETARTQLMYGARLRRSGQRVKAREQLRTAHEAFEEMDLTAGASCRRRTRRHWSEAARLPTPGN